RSGRCCSTIPAHRRRSASPTWSAWPFAPSSPPTGSAETLPASHVSSRNFAAAKYPGPRSGELSGLFRAFGRRFSIIEQVSVGSGACKQHFRVSRLVDQQPVWLQMTFAPTFPVALERVIAACRSKLAAFAKGVEDIREESEIVVAAGDTLEVS